MMSHHIERRRLLRQAGLQSTLVGAGLLAPWLPTAQAQTNSGSTLAPGAVGTLERLQGNASRHHNAGTQNLQLGQSVYEGDRVVTETDSEAVIKMVDGAVVAIRPSTELSLAQYRFSPQKPQESLVLMQLVRGGLRKLTGLIGKTKPSAVRITTATATVGIRGTEFEVVQIEPPVSSTQPPSVSPAPTQEAGTEAASAATPGTYTRVYSGSTTLRSDEDNRQVNVQAGQTAFAPNLAAAQAIGGAVVQSFGLLRNSPARVFFNGRFDGSLQSLANVVTQEVQREINRQLPSELRRVLPDLGNIFKR